jgi:hypothetical protein
MQTKRVRIAWFLFIALGIMAVEGEAWAQGMVPSSNPSGGFTIFYPANWEQRMVGTTLVALSPQESPADTFRENVNVVFENLSMPMSAQQYAMLSLNAMQTQLNGFQLLQQGPVVVGGHQAHFFIYQHMMGQPLQVMAYFLVLGNRGYVITCTASPGDFARYQAFFGQIANTIRFP